MHIEFESHLVLFSFPEFEEYRRPHCKKDDIYGDVSIVGFAWYKAIDPKHDAWDGWQE
jgi:hypothetical protein